MTAGLLLLDTHVWIWAINGEVSRLSKAELEAIEAAEAGQAAAVATFLQVYKMHLDVH